MDHPRYITVSPHFELDRESFKVTERGNGGEITHEFNAPGLGIRIFQDRMKGWFFDAARELLRQNHTVAAVQLVTPLIEALEEHVRGQSSRNRSQAFFEARARALFPSLSEEALHLFYKGVRCGFAHHGFLKDDDGVYNIFITVDLSQPLEYRTSVLSIDSHKYVDAIHSAFEEYCDLVEGGGEAERQFHKVWDPDWQMSLRIPGGGAVSSV